MQFTVTELTDDLYRIRPNSRGAGTKTVRMWRMLNVGQTLRWSAIYFTYMYLGSFAGRFDDNTCHVFTGRRHMLVLSDERFRGEEQGRLNYILMKDIIPVTANISFNIRCVNYDNHNTRHIFIAIITYMKTYSCKLKKKFILSSLPLQPPPQEDRHSECI